MFPYMEKEHLHMYVINALEMEREYALLSGWAQQSNMGHYNRKRKVEQSIKRGDVTKKKRSQNEDLKDVSSIQKLKKGKETDFFPLKLPRRMQFFQYFDFRASSLQNYEVMNLSCPKPLSLWRFITLPIGKQAMANTRNIVNRGNTIVEH